MTYSAKWRSLIALCITSFSFQLSAQYTLTNDDVEVVNGELISTTYTGGGDIIIPEMIDGQEITAIGFNAFRQRGLTGVVFPNTLKIIGTRSFFDNDISTLSLPPSVIEIQLQAFWFNDIASFNLPNNGLGGQWVRWDDLIHIEGDLVTSTSTEYKHFLLEPYTLQDEDVEVVNGRLVSFSLNFNYANMIIPEELDGQTLEVIGGQVFTGYGLQSVILPDGVTEIGYAAFMNNSLSTIDLGENIRFIEDYAFASNDFETFVLPDPMIDGGAWLSGEGDMLITGSNVSELTDSYTFVSTVPYTLTDDDVEVFFGELDSYDPETIHTNIIIPPILDGQEIVKIRQLVFRRKNLSSVTFSGGISEVGRLAFANNAISSINFSEGLEEIDESAFEGNDLTSLSFPQSLIEIGDDAFAHNLFLNDIQFNEGLEEIGAGAFDQVLDFDLNLPDKIAQSGFTYHNWVSSVGTEHEPGSLIEDKSIGYSYETNVPIEYSITFHDDYFNNNPNSYTVLESFDLLTAEREGYSFSGWFLDEDLMMEISAIPQNSTGNLDIYAGWEIVSYEIIYEGAFDHENPSSYNIETPTFQLLPSTRTGYSFEGWYDDIERTHPVEFILNGTTGDAQLYALWDPLDYSVILLDGENELTSFLYNIESESTSLPSMPRDGFDFQGWYLDQDFENRITEIPQGSVGNISVFGKWLELFDVVYNNGFEHDNPEYYSEESGVIELSNPVRNGFNFGGWFEDEAFMSPIFNINSDRGEDLSLYARWFRNFNITYHNAFEHDNPMSYSEASAIVLTDAVRQGYEFQGWFSDEALINEIMQILEGSTGDQDLYASWQPITYSITYHDVDQANNPETYTVETASIHLKQPFKEGYVFIGWFEDSAFTKPVEIINEGSTGTIDVYAQWEVSEVLYTRKSLENKITVYPNPASQFFKVEGHIQELQLLDLNGKMSIEYDINRALFKLEDLPSGVYLLKMKINEDWILRRLVKN